MSRRPSDRNSIVVTTCSAQLIIWSIFYAVSCVGVREITWVIFGKALPWYANGLAAILVPVGVFGGLLAWLVSFFVHVPIVVAR